jgi:hypothetical protein
LGISVKISSTVDAIVISPFVTFSQQSRVAGFEYPVGLQTITYSKVNQSAGCFNCEWNEFRIASP